MELKEYYNELIEVLRYPSKMIKKKKKLTAAEGLKYLALGTIVYAILLSLISIFTGSGVGGLILLIPITVLILIVVTIAWAVSGTIYWIIAILLGCKKDLGNFLGVSGLITGAVSLIIWIPIIGQLLGLYSIYLYYIMFTKAMDMSSGRAILTILIPTIIVVIFVVLIIAVMVAIFGAAMLTSLSGAAIVSPM